MCVYMRKSITATPRVIFFDNCHFFLKRLQTRASNIQHLSWKSNNIRDMNNNIKKILHNKRRTFQGFSFVSQSTSSSKAFPFPKTNGHNYYGGESNPYWQWRVVSTKWNQYLSLAAIITCSLQFISPAQSQ